MLRTEAAAPARVFQATAVVLAVCLAAATAEARRARVVARPVVANLKRYESDYYIIYTDMDTEMAREAYVGLRAMFHEYHRRTKSYAGRVTTKMPFYMLSRREDYERLGGMPGSAGVYTGDKLMAVVSGRKVPWDTIQHEGFHQFARRVIRGRMPVWLNEGLAVYFGDGVWTGDTLECGVIPPSRLKRVKAMIRDKSYLPLRRLLLMSDAEWGAQLRGSNYMQAWAMVHFLGYAEDGKYRKAFYALVRDVSRGVAGPTAFARRIGRDLSAVQNLHDKFWLSLGNNPTEELYTVATIKTLTSFLARATDRGLKFKDIDDFYKAAGDGRMEKALAHLLRRNPRLWLPPALLGRAIGKGKRLKGLSLDPGGRRPPRIVLTRQDGTTLTGTFTRKGSAPPLITVEAGRSKSAAKPKTGNAAK